MNKRYQYKSYQQSTVLRYNRIWQGDFEGNFNYDHISSWAAYWAAIGTPTTFDIYRKDAYPVPSYGQAISLDGISSYAQLNLILAANGSAFNNQPYVGVMGKYASTNWAATSYQALHGSYTINGSGNAIGYGIAMNHTAGYLSALVGLGAAGTFLEAKVLLSSLSAGDHSIGFKYDGTTLTLFVDGVSVATNAGGGGVGIVYTGGSFSQTATYIGARSISTNSTGTPISFFAGTVDSVAIYCRPTTADLPSAAQFLQFHNDDTPQMSTSAKNLTAYWTFADQAVATNVTATTLDELTGAIMFLRSVNVVASTHADSTSLMIVTNTGGSATQGMGYSLVKPSIVGGQSYTAGCWVKATVGRTVNLTIVPVGGGSNQTVSLVATGAWQFIANPYTSNIAATNLEIDVTMSGANGGVYTLLIDKVQLEDGLVANPYFNKDTPSIAGSSYTSIPASKIHQATLVTLTFAATWTDVCNEFKIAKEINNGGSGVTVTLARNAENLGERSDIDFNNQVQIDVINDTYPNGKRVFTGYIADYEPTYGGQESTEVTLLSYGDQANQVLIESGNSVGLDLIGYTSEQGMCDTYTDVPHAITISANTVEIIGITIPPDMNSLVSIDLLLRGNPAADPGGGILQNARAYLWDDYNAAYNFHVGSYGNISITAPILGYTNAIDFPYSTLPNRTTLPFPRTIKVTPGATYYIGLIITPSSTTLTGVGNWSTYVGITNVLSPYVVSSVRATQQYPPVVPIVGNFSLSLLKGNGGTKVAYNSTDPSNILKAILDDAARQGCLLGYDSTTIDLTNTTVSYTFNTNTLFEGIQQVLSLAPAGWYFYIDQATNMVHLHSKETATKHHLTMGKDLETLQLLKRSENIVNIVYFTGGPDPSNPSQNLFKKYVNASSVALYGRHAQKYNDNRVTLVSTMDLIASYILAESASPEVQSIVDIVDGNYDLELIKPGDIIRFRGITNSPNSSLWDVMRWDVDYWDFDIATPETLSTQIARLDYSSEMIHSTLSTTPPDVNKRVEDIDRNLDTAQVLNNPSVPLT